MLAEAADVNRADGCSCAIRATPAAPEANKRRGSGCARFHLFVPPLSMIALSVIQNVYIVRLGRGILPNSTGSAAAAAALIKEFDQWKVSDRS